MFHLSASPLSHCQATSPALLKVFRQSVELLCSVEQMFDHPIICPLLTVSSPTAETLPGNLSQGLSRSCMSAISIVMPPSVCMNKAETALRMKGRKSLIARKIPHQGHLRSCTVIKRKKFTFVCRPQDEHSC